MDLTPIGKQNMTTRPPSSLSPPRQDLRLFPMQGYQGANTSKEAGQSRWSSSHLTQNRMCFAWYGESRSAQLPIRTTSSQPVVHGLCEGWREVKTDHHYPPRSRWWVVPPCSYSLQAAIRLFQPRFRLGKESGKRDQEAGSWLLCSLLHTH